MRRYVVLLLVVTAAFLAGCAQVDAAQTVDVPITLTETTGVARVGDPVSVGVPMPRNLLMNVDRRLCVVDAQGQHVPAQFEALMKWFPTEKYPKAAGVRWLLVDFQADVPANGKATYRLKRMPAAGSWAKAQPKSPVAVKDAGGMINVSTGPLKFVVNKKQFRLFDKVELNGKTVVEAGATDGMCIEGMGGKRYYASKDLSDPPKLTAADYRGGYDGWLKHTQHNPPQKLRVVVEKAGPVRSVILIDGVMTAQKVGKKYQFVLFSGAGDKVGPMTYQTRDEQLGFQIRIHAYAGKPFVRVYHTLINLKGKSHTSTDMNRYRSAAYIADSIKSPGNFLVEALELGTSLKLAGPVKVQLGGDKVHAATLKKGEVRKLYQDTAASWPWQVGEEKMIDPVLKANAKWFKTHPGLEKPYYEYGDIHYKILSGQDGGTFMGYKLYDGGKELLNGYRAPGWADVSDGNVGMTTAVRWFWKMSPKSIVVDGSGKVTHGILAKEWGRGHMMDGKIHRTHELFYRFHGAEGAGVAEASAKAFEEPLVAHCGFEWYRDSGACNLIAKPDTKKWPQYEQQQATAVHVGLNKKINTALDSSIATEREKNDAFGWQHFGDTPKRGFRGHSQFEEFDTSRCLLMHFFRTGDPAFFRAAEELDRFLMNIPSFGGGYGHQHPESSHNWIQGMIDYWCLTGLPEAKEGIDAMKGYYKNCQSNKAGNWHYNGRNAAYALNGLRQMFEITGEKVWLDALNLNVRDVRKRTRAISGFYGGNPGWFMSYVLIHAAGRYAMLTGDEDAVDLVLGLSGHFKPFSPTAKARGLATADAYAYCTMLTGDPHYLKLAARDNNDAVSSSCRKHGPAWRTGACSTKTWSGSVGGYGQVFFHALNEWKPKDTAPPAAITDLKAEVGPEAGSVKLTWTNTGDDGTKGAATKLQVKYAPGEIVEYIHWGRTKGVNGRPADPKDNGKVNFWYATNAKGESVPGKPGTVQSMIIKGLPKTVGRRRTPVKAWWIAVKVHDEAGNRSKLSNCVKVVME
jgi:hypothetical protein